jgi:HPt (histidine-containing phosphotransfer) domain-containing protein
MSSENMYIDIEEGLKRVLNNKQLFFRLLKKFKDETNLLALTDAVNAQDLTSAKEKAHTLKGLSANLSLKKLFLEVQELEAKVKEGIADTEMMKTVQATFDETIKQIQKVIEENGSAA